MNSETDTLFYEVAGTYSKDVYKYCTGYQNEDNSRVVFSYAHFSETSFTVSNNFLIMLVICELASNLRTPGYTKLEYRSRFSHDREVVDTNQRGPVSMLNVFLSACNIVYYDDVGEGMDLVCVHAARNSTPVYNILKYADNIWYIAQNTKGLGEDAIFKEYSKRRIIRIYNDFKT